MSSGLYQRDWPNRGHFSGGIYQRTRLGGWLLYLSRRWILPAERQRQCQWNLPASVHLSGRMGGIYQQGGGSHCWAHRSQGCMTMSLVTMMLKR